VPKTAIDNDFCAFGKVFFEWGCPKVKHFGQPLAKGKAK
jgi:hypothetical protein